MADTKISDLTALTAPALDDLLEIVDVSDTSLAATGTNKKIKQVYLGPLAPVVGGEQSITGTTTLTAADLGKAFVCTGTTGDYTVTLPDPTGHAGEHLELRIDPACTKIVTLDAGAGKLIGPGKSTTLSAAITTTTGTSISVASAAGFPSGQFVVQIDSELLLVTGGFGTTTWTVIRAVGGTTTAATHASGASVDWGRTRSLYMNESVRLRAIGSTQWARVGGTLIPMAAKVRRSSNQTVTNGAHTPILFNLTVDDPAGMVDLVNSRIYPRRPGNYAYSAQAFFINLPANIAGVEVDAKIFDNGNIEQLVNGMSMFGNSGANILPICPGVFTGVPKGWYFILNGYNSYVGAGSIVVSGSATSDGTSLTVEERILW